MRFFNPFVLLIFIFLAIQSKAQENNIVTIIKVSKDSISLKWLPNNYEQLANISKGAKISRIEINDINSNESNFTNAKTWDLPSTLENLNNVTSSELKEKSETLLEPVLKNSNDKKQMNFSFGMNLIENVINYNFQYVLGNILIDKDFDKNKKYRYKIEIQNENSIFINIDPKSITKYSDISDIGLSLDNKKNVNVKWDSKLYNKESFGFYIEHSIDKIQEGLFLNTTPYLPFKSNNEIDNKLDIYEHEATPGHFHYYRLHGLDLFAVKELKSEWVKIYVPLTIEGQVSIDSIFAKDNERIIKSSIKISNKSNVNKIELYRSSKQFEEYNLVESKPINTDSSFTFLINEIKTGDAYYYKTLLINKDDTLSSIPYYFFTLDQEPPNKPQGLSGIIDSNGVVKLSWSNNNEKDLLGYKIFRGNAKKEEFIEQNTSIIGNLFFTDTLALNNLTSEIYYYVKAIDENYNQSLSSDTIMLVKPDTIAPVSVIINHLDINDTVIKVNWINSSSTDVFTNYLVKLSNNKTDTIFVWDDTTSSYIDYELQAGKICKYYIISLDKSNNVAKSDISSKFFEPGFRKPIKNFTAKSDIQNKAIILKWNKPNESVFSYKIYKAESNQKLLPLKTISGKDDTTEYIDKNISINNKYTYTVKYINESGIHSIPAKVEVIYQ